MENSIELLETAVKEKMPFVFLSKDEAEEIMGHFKEILTKKNKEKLPYGAIGRYCDTILYPKGWDPNE